MYSQTFIDNLRVCNVLAIQFDKRKQAVLGTTDGQETILISVRKERQLNALTS